MSSIGLPTRPPVRTRSKFELRQRATDLLTGQIGIVDFSRSWPLTVNPGVARTRALDVERRTAGMVREGSRHVEMSVRVHDATTLVHIEQDLPTGADAAAAPVVGRYLRAVQTELWHPMDVHGAIAVQLSVAFPGRPIAVEARLDLRPSPSGGEQTVAGRATVRLPIIGRLVERKVVAGVLASMGYQVGHAWVR